MPHAFGTFQKLSQQSKGEKSSNVINHEEENLTDPKATLSLAQNASGDAMQRSVLQLQRTIGNRATQEMLAGTRQNMLQKAPRALIAPAPTMSRMPVQRDTADVAAGLEGSLNWVASGTKKKGKELALDSSTGALFWKKANNFLRWIKGKEAFPKDTGNMNCWEAIIYSAIKAEAIGQDAVREAYMTALNAANVIMAKPDGKIDDARIAFNQSLGNWLGLSQKNSGFVDDTAVEKGKLIMRVLQHVVIAVDSEEADPDESWDGGTIVMSLGHFDLEENKAKNTFTKTRLQNVWHADLRRELNVVDPPWA